MSKQQIQENVMTFNELSESAQSDDRQCMDELTRRVQPRIRAYIFRTTMNEDLADDLTQETIMQMITSLTTLREVERFWSWVYRIASSKVNSFFRKQKSDTAVPFSSLEEHFLEAALKDESFQAEHKPVYKELSDIVLNTVSELNHQQRAILSLRCFEDLSYKQIADAVGCNESTARVQFMRARNQVKKTLKSKGIKGHAVLLAIVLFGKLTAGEQALAATVTTSTVGFNATVGIGTVIRSLCQSSAVQATVA